MNSPPVNHPGPDALAAFVLHLLGDDQSNRVAGHLHDCENCRFLLGTLAEHQERAAESTAPPGGGKQYPLANREENTGPRVAQPFSLDETTAVELAIHALAGLAEHPRYEVLRLIGSGGMGVVFKARHRLMDRLV